MEGSFFGVLAQAITYIFFPATGIVSSIDETAISWYSLIEHTIDQFLVFRFDFLGQGR